MELKLGSCLEHILMQPPGFINLASYNTMTITQDAVSNPLILRLIFLHLPIKELLLAQRVCQGWRRLIKKSNSLQQALFFVPDDTPVDDGTVSPNELLMERFSGFYIDGTHLSSRKCIGPLASTDFHRLSRTQGDNPSTAAAYNDAAFSRPEASWRHMLPCQPAPTELQVVYSLESMGGKHGTVKALRFDKNSHSEQAHLTFGVIYDLVQAFMLPSSTNRPGFAANVEIIGFTDQKKDVLPEDEQERKRFLIQRNSRKAYRQHHVKSMRTALPEINFAGEGCVVVRLCRVQQCCVGGHIQPGQIWYSADYLKSDASLVGDGKSIEWDVEKNFFVR
ncbi:uncharacterized protein MYCFIDRAFT_214978 [Pseudocercospora fijiensis CIRAD86]|uniref:F-box domain-containing protein n=1 Tax=Pseudocercospora fijiensis (strain CIRAD86) TaxID=383855 RepID=M3AKU9_PSEFD|nr:uncharacterized protein MYCFIDRAFT_214978 [Pseudocercospora fijiensis CIRAD86]EME85201.1 hypothetical protein MYCFIDRAFT_214978 [Pseudocercospora fijiensis CIRAD86]